MNNCFKCGNVYDTDFQMEADKDGNMICNKCFKKEEDTEEKLPKNQKTFMTNMNDFAFEDMIGNE